MGSKPVIVRLKGGIGNQLFQYALYMSLKRRNLDVIFEKSLLIDDSIESSIDKIFRLDDVSSMRVSRYDLRRLALIILNRIGIKKTSLMNYILDERMEFDVLSPKPNSILEGYWQNLSYFQGLEAEFDRLIHVDNLYLPLDKSFFINFEAVKNINTLVIHIRKSDYMFNSILCSYDEGYFYRAINQFENIKEIIVFTDDIEWVNGHLKNLKYTLLKNTPEIDLLLMAHAVNLIISNSTFSWWSAHLYRTKISKKVVVPDKWFKDERYNFNAYHDSWIRVKNSA